MPNENELSYLAGTVAALQKQVGTLNVAAGTTAQYWRGDKLWATLNQAAVAGLTTADSPAFMTVKCSGLTDGYVPYHVADATGLANSVIYTDGTKISVNAVYAPRTRLHVYEGAVETYTPSLTTDNGIFTITQGAITNEVQFGAYVADPYGMWIQVKQSNNSGASFPLILNPLGGNVGINDPAPAEKLDVDGNINVTGGYKIDDVLIAQKDITGLTTADSPTFSGLQAGTLAHAYGGTTITAETQLEVRGATGNFFMYASGDNSAFGMATNHNLNIRTNNTNWITILKTGNVGINDPAPAEALDVTGNINVTGAYKVDDVQVVKEQQAHIADLNAAYAAGDLDTEAEIITAINATNAKINAILAMLEAHGLVAGL